jgi:PAS domain S-box-containing protein
MKKMHTLLARQIKRNFGESFSLSGEWERFVSDVNDAYGEFDTDRAMLERSMDLSSKELLEMNTHLRRKEELVIAERDVAQRILDIAGVIILMIDCQGRVTMINRKGCEILGYSQDEIVGTNWFETCIPEKLRDEVSNVFNKLLTEDIDTQEYFENVVVASSRRELIIAWHNNLMRDKEGNIIGILSSGEDITNSKRAQDELKVRMLEIEKLNKFMIGREMRIIEMKKEVNDLLKQAGHAPRYKV